ncbi:MAG TPA: helix-turn-helix domain-containing protein [Candidatus Thermoplasmatota archaeon]|nr:helix-turn-helix domain-containing protein [Candidatus Thermoplasmatota archaeon]
MEKSAAPDPLDSAQRQMLLRIIQRKPGLMMSELHDLFPYSWGALYHHLKVLTEAGLVEVGKDGNRREVFPIVRGKRVPAQTEKRERLPRIYGKTKIVAEYILTRPGCDMREILENLDVDRRLAYLHVERFVREGWVTSDSETRYRGLKPTPEFYRVLGLAIAARKE